MPSTHFQVWARDSTINISSISCQSCQKNVLYLYIDHGLNGFLSRDRTTINVDEFQYEQFNEEYRYTLAHELGHYVLHKSCYEDLPFESPDEYAKWRMSMPPEDIGWFETHGDWFAGHVLVPTNRLEEICLKCSLKISR